MALLFKRIKLLFYTITQTINSILYKALDRKNAACRIEEIDLIKNRIIIHCRGVNAPVKLTFDEIINDFVLLSNLTSKYASWIGYYYGKYYYNLTEKHHNILSNLEFSIEDTPGKLSITMLNRKGDLICHDRDHNTSRTISPVNAMIQEKIIMSFNSIEACYIGILASTSKKNIISKRTISSKNGHLKVIK